MTIKEELLIINEMLNGNIEKLQESIITRTSQEYFNLHHDILNCSYNLNIIAFKSWNAEKIEKANKKAKEIILKLHELILELDKKEFEIPKKQPFSLFKILYKKLEVLLC